MQMARSGWIVPLIIGLYMLIGLTSVAFAAPSNEVIQQPPPSVDMTQVESYWNKLMKEYGGFFPDNKPPTFSEMLMTGAKSFSLTGMLQAMLKYLFHEILMNGKLLATIIILTVFSMILETLHSSFERNTISKVGYSITYLVLIVLAINSFYIAIDYAKSAISRMIEFMFAVVPILLTLLASSGSLATVAVLHPLIVFVVNAVGTAVYYFVFPLLFFSTILNIVSFLSEKYKVTYLAKLLQTVSLSLLGFFVTVFLGVISVQGATGAVADGVTLRTAKFIAGSFVPVVGRMFTDATDTVITASLLMKNAIGLAGVAIILLLCAFPAIKILTLALIYKVSAAVMQPLGDSPMIACLQMIGKSMIYVFAALSVVSLMFFLAITIIITAGNVTVMVR